MPARVSISERIISGIGISVKVRRVARVGHNRISLREPPERGVVVSGVVLVQANGFVKALAGVAHRRLYGHVAVSSTVPSIPQFAKCSVAVFPQFDAAAIDDDTGAAQVVAEHIAQAVVLWVSAAPEGDKAGSGAVVLGVATALGLFVMRVGIVGCLTVDNSLDAVAVSVICVFGHNRRPQGDWLRQEGLRREGEDEDADAGRNAHGTRTALGNNQVVG